MERSGCRLAALIAPAFAGSAQKELDVFSGAQIGRARKHGKERFQHADVAPVALLAAFLHALQVEGNRSCPWICLYLLSGGKRGRIRSVHLSSLVCRWMHACMCLRRMQATNETINYEISGPCHSVWALRSGDPS